MPEQGGKFRVLVGFHLGYGPAGCACEGCRTRWEGGQQNHKHEPDPEVSGPRVKHCACGALLVGGGFHRYASYESYAAQCRLRKQKPVPRDQYHGDIIETDQDLCARMNQLTSRKFARVSAPAPAQPPASAQLERLSIPQLVAHAEELNIDTKGLGKRADLIAAIRAAQKPATA